MAEIKTLIINVKDGEIDVLNDKLQKVDSNVSKAERTTNKFSGEIKKSSAAVRFLDRYTGGLASSVIEVANGFKGVNIQLNATKAALIATGIGAFVVILGTIVAYWEEIRDFIFDINSELEEQLALNKEIELSLERQAQSQKDNLRFTDLQTKERILRAKIAGATQEELTKIERQGLADRVKLFEENARRADEILKTTVFASAEAEQKAVENQIKAYDDLAAAKSRLGIFDLEQQIPEDQKPKRGADQQKADASLYNFGPLTGLSLTDALPQAIDLELELLRAGQHARTESEKAEARARILLSQREFEEKQRNLYSYADAIGAVGNLIGQETASGKALAVAATLINTYASIAGQLKAFSGVPIPGYAIAQAIATAAVGFKAVKDIIAVKVPGSTGGANVASPIAPAFNVVQSSGQNQLNQALLERNNDPIEAFVTEGQISTSQELKRKKVAASSL